MNLPGTGTVPGTNPPVQNACWPYNGGGQSNYQNVNYNGTGPYTPTRY
jgi:hypothetical protein